MSKAKNKTIENDASVAGFLDSIIDEKRKTDALLLNDLMTSLTGEEPVMWGDSIVRYGRYDYRYDSGREGSFMKVGFSPRKQYLALYIMPGFQDFEPLMAQLGRYKTGKSCLYIKKIEDVDLSTLKTLIKSSYQEMTTKYG